MVFLLLLTGGNIYLIVTLIIVVALFWGYVTKTIMANKGYNSDGTVVGWFLLGVIFQEYAMAFALTKKDADYAYRVGYSKKSIFSKTTGENEAEKRMRMSAGIIRAGGWECAFCGRAIVKSFETCGCGKTKAETIEKREELVAQEHRNDSKV